MAKAADDDQWEAATRETRELMESGFPQVKGKTKKGEPAPGWLPELLDTLGRLPTRGDMPAPSAEVDAADLCVRLGRLLPL
jgi:hypothetical protein